VLEERLTQIDFRALKNKKKLPSGEYKMAEGV